MAKINEFVDFHPKTRQEWRDWLAENHVQAQGVWFVYYKKAANQPRVSYDEAVEEALCFGWIDSLPRKIDDKRSKLMFTTRKPKSVWSRLNKTRVEKLIANGAMTEIGLEKIETAKKNGSWNALDASDNLEMPTDLIEAFAANKSAKASFEAFSDSAKRMILSWIFSAKRDETRAARIGKTVQMAAQDKRANFDK